MASLNDFGKTATSLSRSPLGIIALFIVLIYGVAALLLGVSAGKLDPGERWPLVWFLAGFPVLVLGVFGWLVSRHHTKLYAPADFRDEANFMQAIGRLQSDLQKANRKIEEFRNQAEFDVRAQSLAYQQLHGSSDVPALTQEQLNKAVSAASTSCRAMIFNQSCRVRAQYWSKDKQYMERTIPIFRSLIHSDPENRYHRNHGQLGFALKDQRQPDWAEAERELSSAIQARGPWQEAGWQYYEFNRAICRVMLDGLLKRHEPSPSSTRKRIVKDLRAVWRSEIRHLLDRDPVLSQWIQLNKVEEAELAET